MNLRSPTSKFLYLLGFFLLCVGIRFELIGNYADSMPYWDDFVTGDLLFKYQTGVLTLSDLFVDANEHRLVFNRILSLFYFEANQNQWDPKIAMLGNSILWAISGVILLSIAVKYLNSTNAALACAVIVVFWLSPISLDNVIWGFQTHTYTMILFMVLGCWWTTFPFNSAKWWFGVIALACAPLTLAGGTFASFAVAALSTAYALGSRFRRAEYNWTSFAALVTGAFGLALILTQSGEVAVSAGWTLKNGVNSLFRTLSWPRIDLMWPAALFLVPITILFFQTLVDETKRTQFARFTISLYLALFIISLAIAYSRGASGNGPARRYFEYLTLMPMCSLFAAIQLQSASSKIFKVTSLASIFAILMLLFSAIPRMHHVFEFTVNDQLKIKQKHTKNVMSFMNSGDESWLLSKGFRGVPFPRGEDLGQMLIDYNELDLLPYQIQTPRPLQIDHRWSAVQVQNSPFRVNGTLLPSKGLEFERPFEQDVFGSYRPQKGGVKATGGFTSTEFHHTRDYIAVPITGYFGYPGLSLKFVEYGSGKEYELKPEIVNNKQVETWKYVINKLPKGYYHLVAEDQNTDLWFGFATPKSVGRWSYYSEQIIDAAYWFWYLGIGLILLALGSVYTRTNSKVRASY